MQLIYMYFIWFLNVQMYIYMYTCIGKQVQDLYNILQEKKKCLTFVNYPLMFLISHYFNLINYWLILRIGHFSFLFLFRCCFFSHSFFFFRLEARAEIYIVVYWYIIHVLQSLFCLDLINFWFFILVILCLNSDHTYLSIL